MGFLEDDLAAIHADAIGLGMGDSATYTTVSGAAVALSCTFNEMPQPFIGAEGGEVRRRECSVDILRSDVALPAKGDHLTVAAGAFAGTWTVVEISSADSAGWLVNVRLDDRVAMGHGRRLP